MSEQVRPSDRCSSRELASHESWGAAALRLVWHEVDALDPSEVPSESSLQFVGDLACQILTSEPQRFFKFHLVPASRATSHIRASFDVDAFRRHLAVATDEVRHAVS